MLKLLEFDFSIEYKQGKANTVADALSRKHSKSDDTCVVITAAIPTWINEVELTYKQDERCIQLLQELAVNPTSHQHFTLSSGILRYKNRIVIGTSTDLKEKIFNSFHSSIFGGHSDSRVTHHRLKHLFYWPLMKQYIDEKVSICPICQISKTERVHYPGLLHPLHIPAAKWSDLSMDFITGLPKSKGQDVILVIVDRLTKYAHFLTLSHPFTAQQVAKLFVDTFFKLHGPPSTIVSDRDSIFTSKFWQEFFKILKVQLNYSTAYH
jgi:hypothetical protein